MNKLGKAINETLKVIKQAQARIEILKILEKHEKSMPGYLSVTYTLDILTLTGIKKIEQLHEIRQWLKKCFGTWQDKKGTIWFSEGEMLCSWKSIEYPINIWLHTDPENFPKELQSDKCKVVELEPVTQKRYAYVCEKDK